MPGGREDKAIGEITTTAETNFVKLSASIWQNHENVSVIGKQTDDDD